MFFYIYRVDEYNYESSTGLNIMMLRKGTGLIVFHCLSIYSLKDMNFFYSSTEISNISF